MAIVAAVYTAVVPNPNVEEICKLNCAIFNEIAKVIYNIEITIVSIRFFLIILQKIKHNL